MSDYSEDELIDVKLPRAEYKILKDVIQREEAYNWFYKWITGNWIFIVGGGILTLMLLYEKIIGIK